MRIPNEIVHEDANTIEFTMFDDVMNKTARKFVDRSMFLSIDPADRDLVRQHVNSDLKWTLDREARRLDQAKNPVPEDERMAKANKMIEEAVSRL